MKKIIIGSVLAALLLSSCSWGGKQSTSVDEVVQTNANYMVYENQDFAMSDDAQVLFFHAKWCPDCVTAHKNIAESSTTAGVKIYKIDYDNSDELKKKYEVTKQHTFVQIDAMGNMIKKWSGTKTLDSILEEVVMPTSQEGQMQDDNMQESEISQENMEDVTTLEEVEDSMEKLESQMEMEVETEVSTQNNIEAETQEEMEVEVQQESQARNSYVEYSSDMLADGNSKVLFFHATWCPSCKAADKSFTANDNTIGVDVVKVDYDSYTDLKEKYGIVSQHTFVFVDSEGNMMKRWFGSRSYEDILKELQS